LTEDDGDAHERLRQDQDRDGPEPLLNDVGVVRECREERPAKSVGDQPERRKHDRGVLGSAPCEALCGSCVPTAKALRDERRRGDAKAISREEADRLDADERLIGRHGCVPEEGDDGDEAEVARVIEHSFEQRRESDLGDGTSLVPYMGPACVNLSLGTERHRVGPEREDEGHEDRLESEGDSRADAAPPRPLSRDAEGAKDEDPVERDVDDVHEHADDEGCPRVSRSL
jgi:hypothetical protein